MGLIWVNGFKLSRWWRGRGDGLAEPPRTFAPRPRRNFTLSPEEAIKAREYPFRKEMVRPLFEAAVKLGKIVWPQNIGPEDPERAKINPYCPFHRMNNHSLETCIPFQIFLEKALNENKLALTEQARNPNYVKPAPRAAFLERCTGRLIRCGSLVHLKNAWLAFTYLIHRPDEMK